MTPPPDETPHRDEEGTNGEPAESQHDLHGHDPQAHDHPHTHDSQAHDPLAPPPVDGGRGAHWRRKAGDPSPPGPIGVLRIGHRPGRDKRITTHICLTARAFGADVAYIHEDDPRVVATVRDVVRRFGGPFDVYGIDAWRPVVTRWKQEGAQIVHLTMYGQSFEQGLARLDPKRATLFVAGAEKVPPDIYERADVNLSVGNQPHSEVAATAVVLDRFLTGDWARKPFEGRVQVVPRERGKAVSSSGTQ